MKKIYLSTVFLLTMALTASAQFTAGNLVVSRVGNGSTALSGNTAPVSLLEFTTTGVAQASAVSTTALNSANISISGTTAEGQLSLSADNSFLVFGAYGVPSGELATSLGVRTIAVSAAGTGYTSSPTVTISAPNIAGGVQATAGAQLSGSGVGNIYIMASGSGYTSAPTVTITGGGGTGATAGAVTTIVYWQAFSTKKTIAKIDVNQSVDLSTSFPSSGPAVVGAVKGAVSADGNSFYLNANRLEYVTLGQTTAATEVFPSNARSISVQGNKLSFLQGYNTPTLRYTDTALPTASSTATAVPGIPNNANSFGYYFFDGDATLGYNGTPYDVLYIADGGGLQKFYYDGTTWNAAGNYAGAIYSMTGKSVAGKAVIYAITGSGNNAANSLVSITDNATRTGSITTTVPTSITLATAAANYGFRGVAFTPSSTINTVLPIKLTSFKGEAKGSNNRLSWSTSSEVNFKEFVVEKSLDGKNFAKAGSPVSSKGLSTGGNYSFIDYNVGTGTFYYRLKSVDNDGAFEYTDIVAIKSALSQTQSVVVYPNPTTGPLTIQHAEGLDNATISINDISGRQVKFVNITKNSTSTSIDLNELKPGIYFVNVINGEKQVFKLVKN